MRAINTLNPPKEYICKLGGLLPIRSTRWRGVQGLMWGARGPFPLVAAMVVAVVTPVVFCLRLLKKEMKTLKLVGGYQKVYLLLYVIKHIVIHILLIVVWPEPKLWHGRSPNHYGPMDPGILGITKKLLSLRE